jgi:hypothetical protein
MGLNIAAVVWLYQGGAIRKPDSFSAATAAPRHTPASQLGVSKTFTT